MAFKSPDEQRAWDLFVAAALSNHLKSGTWQETLRTETKKAAQMADLMIEERRKSRLEKGGRRIDRTVDPFGYDDL